MSKKDTIDIFGEWGKRIQGAVDSGSLEPIIDKAVHHNPWHTRENILFALSYVVRCLEPLRLTKWLERYPDFDDTQKPNTVAVIMNGDVPLAGFRDMLAVLISGNRVLAKLSDNDDVMIPALTKILLGVAPEYEDYITFAEGRMYNFDAVIATSTGTPNLYFEKYFSKYPHIIHHPKHSVAVLLGNETDTRLQGLADDIFLYMGLGCRSVSKLYVPQNYDFSKLIKASEKYRYLFDNNQYKSSLDYHKALLLLNAVPFVDGDFWMMKQEATLETPVSVINYEFYENIAEVQSLVANNADKLQCVVTDCKDFINRVPLGKAQKPELWDYADAIDTISFLIDLK